MSGFNTKERNNNGEFEITFYTENRQDFKKVQDLCRELIGHGTPISTEGDLISRSEAEKLGATCLARRNENGQLEAIISLDEAPTVETDIEVVAQDAYKQGYTDGWKERFGEPNDRPRGEWIRYKDNPHQPEHIKCSNCGQYWSIADHDKTFDFCFKCGADMRGKEE